jgi:type IV pilus assembly protein PilE
MNLQGRAARPGFTLIEVLVVLAVTGVLAAVAYPGFQLHVVRTKRVEAQGTLYALMQQQERYFTLHNRYLAFTAGATDPDGTQFRWWSGSTAATSAYEIEGRACAGEQIADCVELVATPGTARVDSRFRDQACDQLILNSKGAHQSTGPAQRCWR